MASAVFKVIWMGFLSLYFFFTICYDSFSPKSKTKNKFLFVTESWRKIKSSNICSNAVRLSQFAQRKRLPKTLQFIWDLIKGLFAEDNDNNLWLFNYYLSFESAEQRSTLPKTHIKFSQVETLSTLFSSIFTVIN